jgi:glyoxylase-like metal-dependent hydrolase (beta-lactamase superfamily II)
MRKEEDGVIRINLVVANVYIVRGRRTVLVDTGAETSAGWIMRAMNQHGVSPNELSMILLTHAPVDHAGSARRLRDRLGAPVAVHQADAAMLHTPGHTAGSISLLFDDGDAIAGDVLRGGIMGGAFLASKPAYPYFLPSMDDKPVLLDSVQKLLDAGARRFLVGHGGPLKRDAVQRWLDAQR